LGIIDFLGGDVKHYLRFARLRDSVGDAVHQLKNVCFLGYSNDLTVVVYAHDNPSPRAIGKGDNGLNPFFGFSWQFGFELQCAAFAVLYFF
jgi:hypothetical protein